MDNRLADVYMENDCLSVCNTQHSSQAHDDAKVKTDQPAPATDVKTAHRTTHR